MGRSLERKQACFRGLETSWLEGGDSHATTLMFLHGYPDTADCWDAQLNYFASDFHVIAPYVRGAQPSAKALETSRYSLDAITLDHLSLLSKVDPTKKKPVVLIGHDLGAAQAWHLAPLLGSRVHGLIILNGLSLRQMSQRLSTLRQHLKSWYIYAMQVPLVSDWALRRFPGKFLRFAYRQGGLSPSQQPQLKQVLGAVVNPAKQYRAYVKDWLAKDQSMPKKLNCPVLVLWGHQDRFLMVPQQQEFLADAKDVTIRVLRGNHWLHRENPQVINELIEEFVKDAAPTHN